MLCLLCSMCWFAVYLIIFILFLIVAYSVIQRQVSGKGRIAVVVVGDFGRSPRMQYHSLSLSKVASQVLVVAVEGSKPCEGVMASNNIDMSYLMKPAVAPSNLPWIVKMVYRVILNSVRLPLTLLFRLPKCDAMIIQNPPAIPVLPAAVIACKIRGIKLIVDWHNLGYTLLEMDNRPKVIVQTYKFIERFFGKYSDYNFTVCQSLKKFLKDEWKCIKDENSTVVYDVAPSFFSRSGPNGAKRLFESDAGIELLGSQYSVTDFIKDDKWNSTRPCIMVTGTSWTIDEDVGMLLDALRQLDELLSDSTNTLPSKIVMFITGKGGDIKTTYERTIASMNLKHISIRTGYLEKFSDYATLLGVADVGISLHNSSSGFDLPMKAVDMLGSQLPVFALFFETLRELINVQNGNYFSNIETLTDGLDKLLRDWKVDPSDVAAASPLLETKRSFIQNNPRGTWDQQWGSKVWFYIQLLLFIIIFIDVMKTHTTHTQALPVVSQALSRNS